MKPMITYDKNQGVAAVDGSTKARIERAALILFAEHGINGVSTKQIAAQAGLSEGAIYRHFSGKEELARSMMQTIHTRLTHMILDVGNTRESHETLADQADKIVEAYCDIADTDWTLFQYHILHLHHFPNLGKDSKDNPIGAAARLIRAAQKRGDIAKSDPVVTASMALGVVIQSAQAKVFGLIQSDLSKHKPIFKRAVRSVLGLPSD